MHFNIFYIENEEDLTRAALGIFHFQWQNCGIYRQYCDSLNIDPGKIKSCPDIPFLPVSFFKTHKVNAVEGTPEKIFLSSGTTGMERSRHLVYDLHLYRNSLQNGFRHFYGDLADYEIFGLMPPPEENPDSSLVYMVQDWISMSNTPISGFYLNRKDQLMGLLRENRKGRKKLVIGLSYALLDLAEEFPGPLREVIIMETGGMKGKRKEMIREELHGMLQKAFSVRSVHSEYGMTELLSQAYSKGKGLFRCPPWMKVLIRDADDPLTMSLPGKTGGINVIDLANINSCSFLALQDLGKIHPDGFFEVLGRFDDSDVRGCNLMIS